MKKLFFTLSVLFISLLAMGQENYVKSTSFKTPVQNETEIENLTDNNKIQQVNYVDGLGRAKQSVLVRAGGNTEDIITHFEYDGYGRQAKQYLPFAKTISQDGAAIHANPLADLNTFYLSDKYENTTNPYSEKRLETSPVSRVFEQGAPGADWEINPTSDNDHTIVFDYKTNTVDEVMQFEVNFNSGNTEAPNLVYLGYYPEHMLYKTITKDENWIPSKGKNHTTEEFKDKQGRVILKRTYNGSTNPHDTHYVYDRFGNLTYVLSPKGSDSILDTNNQIQTAILNNLCYQYKYDSRNRLVEKKIPGKDWEYIVYDLLDRPILTQDANQRLDQVWLATKYDAFSRPIHTGTFWKIKYQFTRLELQAIADAVTTPLYESRTTTPNIPADDPSISLYYTNDVFPAIKKFYTVDYYDDYNNIDTDGITAPTNSLGVIPITNVKSLATVSKVRVLDTDRWITTVTYYDDKARPIYERSKNQYLFSDDIALTKYDFSGNPIVVRTQHKRGALANIFKTERFTYDHMNRLIKATQQIDGENEELIAKNTYDELGQLEQKEVGNTETQPLQTVDYTYNIRGWLKKINDHENLGTDLFSFEINYNEPVIPINVNGNTVPELFNGNISETIWKTASLDYTGNPSALKAYRYGYDYLNRIRTAYMAFGNTTAYTYTGAYNLFVHSYDKNGNILKLYRNGKHPSPGNYAAAGHDRLVYTYNGNQLTEVDDEYNIPHGYNEGSNAGAGIDYTYDANGNMITDAAKGIDSIKYNHLNLPTQVTIGAGNIKYVYDATGVKQKKMVSTGATTTYAGNYIYENNALKFFSTAEGYIEPNPKGKKSYNYVYQYKDHLGNIRLSYSDFDNNGQITAASEILEENNYYPFGLKHKGYNNVINGTHHPYGYNGKEEQEELGLNWLDFSARNYDAALGRWMNLDPLAELMRRHSPYNFAYDNPIFFQDPDGMMPCPTGDCPDPPTGGNNPPPVDGSLSGVDATRSTSAWVGYTGVATENLRNSYKNSLNSNTTKAQRTQIKTKMQSKEPALTKAIRESKRPASKEGSMPKNNPSKTNAKFDKAAKTMGDIGKVGIVTGLAASGYNIATADNKLEATAIEGGSWGGAILGGEMGAVGGAEVGGPWGALIGGVGGSILGGYMGEEAVRDMIGPQNPAMSRSTTIAEDIEIGDLNPREMVRKHSCFIKGTKILMADGSEKNVEDIKKGDKILSVDISKKTIESDIVLAIPTEIIKYRRIIAKFDNGVKNEFSPAHPYYVIGKGWSVFDLEDAKSELKFDVSKIEVGDSVYYYDNGILKLSKITYLKDTNEYIEMYNVENVKKNHTFFANGILVHNKYMANKE